MRLAWLRADTPRSGNPLDDTAALIDVLRSTHDVQLFTPDTGWDLAAQHERAPFDLSVFELDSTPAHAPLWPLLQSHPGVLMLRTLALPDVQTAVLASLVTVVAYPSVADELRARCPASHVRTAAIGVAGVHRDRHLRVVPGDQAKPVVFGALSSDRGDFLRRVLDRAWPGADTAPLLTDCSPEEVLRQADVIVAVPWPWTGQPATEALAAMAAGTPVVVLETEGTAHWPALDPQSWQRRGPMPDPPIAVSIDPLDEEHSLVLAVRRLSADAVLRSDLGAAAKEWWRTHATPEHAAADWETILSEATERPTPPTLGR